MPTARELLEQVDALMRRNRALSEIAGAPDAAELPVLTEAVSEPAEAVPVLTEAVPVPTDPLLPCQLDVDADAELQRQLAARLQPIAERASAELAKTIEREVGPWLRRYVAEAVAREIDRRRRGEA